MTVQQLITAFQQAADTNKKTQMEAYMKHHFPFFGVQKTERSKCSKPFIHYWKTQPLQDIYTIVETLWAYQERELHYTAIDLLWAVRKRWNIEDIEFFEQLIIQNVWWDSIDYWAGTILGHYFKMYPQQIAIYIPKWRNSSTIWLVRCTLLFQLKYKTNTNKTLLFEICYQHRHSNEFFIQKAIGWALRQYSYSNPTEVQQFIEATTDLTPLSKREGMKAILRKAKRKA